MQRQSSCHVARNAGNVTYIQRKLQPWPQQGAEIQVQRAFAGVGATVGQENRPERRIDSDKDATGQDQVFEADEVVPVLVDVAGLEAAATALDMTVEELRTALADGDKTIAAVAEEQGVDVQTVIDTLVTAAGAHLAEHVTAGDLTQEEADAKLAELTTRITDAVNNGGPIGGGRGGEMGGRGGHGPRGDDAPAASTEGTTTGGVTVEDTTA